VHWLVIVWYVVWFCRVNVVSACDGVQAANTVNLIHNAEEHGDNFMDGGTCSLR
jgi:hypothetical protein